MVRRGTVVHADLAYHTASYDCGPVEADGYPTFSLLASEGRHERSIDLPAQTGRLNYKYPVCARLSYK